MRGRRGPAPRLHTAGVPDPTATPDRAAVSPAASPASDRAPMSGAPAGPSPSPEPGRCSSHTSPRGHRRSGLQAAEC